MSSDLTERIDELEITLDYLLIRLDQLETTLSLIDAAEAVRSYREQITRDPSAHFLDDGAPHIDAFRIRAEKDRVLISELRDRDRQKTGLIRKLKRVIIKDRKRQKKGG